MGKTLEQRMQQSSTDPASPGRVDHADADQLEVLTEPRIGDLGRQNLAGVVSRSHTTRRRRRLGLLFPMLSRVRS